MRVTQLRMSNWQKSQVSTTDNPTARYSGLKGMGTREVTGT